VKVTITNKSLKECKVIASFLNDESLEQIIEGLSRIRHATATINGNNVTIEGGKDCEGGE
jgi:hypothetical protein